jgi:ubiquinone/menaquinone biosynthesis C-methylase UbiE
VEHAEAIELIRGAVTVPGGAWADLGAGAGTFTRALAALVGVGGVVYAVDRDARSLRELAGAASSDGASVRTLVGDFTEPLDDLPRLNGVLVANALHYVPYADQPRVLERIARMVDPPGVVVIVEYERREANRWVPFPLSFEPLRGLAKQAGLADPARLATRPSRYSGSIYSAVVRVG